MPRRPPRRLPRPVLAALVTVVAAVLVTGCANHNNPASGVYPGAHGVTVQFKPCDTQQGVARLRVFDPKNRQVWSATAPGPAAAGTELTIGATVPGYSVDDRLGAAGLRRGTTYRLVARSTKGDPWNGPTFDPGDLHAGEVLSAGKRVDERTWLAAGPSCRGRSAMVIAGGALLAGLAAAVLVGVLLGPLWLLRRAAMRRARQREGHLPWLHDPPPLQATRVRWWPRGWRWPRRGS